MQNNRIQTVLLSISDKKSFLNFIICLVLIVFFFHSRYGLGMINPTETAWLMKYDWAQHYMGWYFFRNEPWGFPLGEIHNLFYPIGTNVGFTDSIPLAAILIKPFSGLLPEQFQYFGFWLFLNYVLLAFFSIRLCQLLKIQGPTQLMLVVLVTFCPPHMYRAMHTALSSHWLVVANLWVYLLDPRTVAVKKILVYQFLLLLAGGLINPYFVVINGGFSFILSLKLWRLEKVITAWKAIVYLFGSVAALVCAWTITGYFKLSSASNLGVTGAYGSFSWNLSSLFNPFNYDRFFDYSTHNLSSFLPARELVSGDQYESFSYLGLGILVLLFIITFLLIISKRSRATLLNLAKNYSLLLLFFLTLGLTLFAISNKVTFYEKELFSFPIPSFSRLFTDIFRCSARFIWVGYYLLFFFLVFMLSRSFKKEIVTWSVLGLVFILQFSDIRQMIFNNKLEYGPYHGKLTESLWTQLIQSTDQLLFLPPLQSSYLTLDDWRYFSYLAIQNRKPISVGHIARIDFEASRNFHQKILDQILSMTMDTTAIYITLPGSFTQFLTNYAKDKVEVFTLDGYLVVCPKPFRNPALSEAILEVKQKVDQTFIHDHFLLQNPKEYKATVKDNNPIIKIGTYEISKGVDSYVVRGWCFIDDAQKFDSETVNVLIKDANGNKTAVPAIRFGTADVADFFHRQELTNVGFAGMINVRGMPNGRYQLGVEIVRTLAGSTTYENQWIDQHLVVNNPAPPLAVSLNHPSDKIKFDINIFKVNKTDVEVEGWAFAEDKLDKSQIFITVSDSLRLVAFETTPVQRQDVADFFKDPTLKRSGFLVRFEKSNLGPGPLKIGILIKSANSTRQFHKYTDKLLDESTNSSVERNPPVISALEFPPPTEVNSRLEATENSSGFVDKISEEKYYFMIEGWAFINNIDAKETQTYLVLRNKNRYFKVRCPKRFRPDVQQALKHTFNTDSCGFGVGLRKEYIPEGQYDLWIMMENPDGVFVKKTENKLKF